MQPLNCELAASPNLQRLCTHRPLLLTSQTMVSHQVCILVRITAQPLNCVATAVCRVNYAFPFAKKCTGEGGRRTNALAHLMQVTRPKCVGVCVRSTWGFIRPLGTVTGKCKYAPIPGDDAEDGCELESVADDWVESSLNDGNFCKTLS